MTAIKDLEYKIRRFQEEVKKEAGKAKRNAYKYGNQFVRTNKQEDRHAAMRFEARAALAQDLLKILEE